MFFMSTIMVRCDIIFYRHILTASGGVTTNFAKKNGYSELMPYFCETDKAVMEHFGGTLYREHTVADGYEDCDYWIKNKGEST